MAPVLEGIWGVGLLKNTNVYDRSGMAGVKEAIKAGNGDAYMWVRGSFDSYAWFGWCRRYHHTLNCNFSILKTCGLSW